MVPEPLDAAVDYAGAVPARTHRFPAQEVAAEPPQLAQWWLGNAIRSSWMERRAGGTASSARWREERHS